MKKVVFVLLISSVTAASFAQTKKPIAKLATTATAKKQTVTPQGFKNNIDSVSYALGVRIAQNVKNQGFENINQIVFNKAFNDVLKGNKLALGDSTFDVCIGGFQQKAQLLKSSKAKAEGKVFLDANAKRNGVKVLPSGLQYEVIKTGTDSTKPTINDKVKCHYHGTLVSGKVFDSSVDRGEPITFAVSGVIRGWTEALQLMTVGSKWKIYLPSDLAYGDQQAGPSIAPGSTLIFTVELLSIEK